MKVKTIPTVMEISYFRLSLLSYLRDSHPDKASDRDFIALRGDEAAEAYSAVIQNGGTYDEAETEANKVLYAGLYFSPYRILVNILLNEFSDVVPPETAPQIALKLMPQLKENFKKYDLSDEFDSTHEYDFLYTELTGEIQILLENGKF